ncbi:MAG: hypothetical protein LC754_03360 [Acidobacteria bacterium]|nr:hypothetical protein [Acidobacteriota bacterium]
MRNGLMKVALVAFALAVGSTAGTQARARSVAQGAEAPLTNASVVKLVRAGFSEKTVIAIIRARPARFDLTPERLIELKKDGVSEKVILVMLAREDDRLLSSDELDDDGFFGRAGGTQGQKQGSGEVDIFGSSGGSRGRTRSRNGHGGVEGDTQTSGSATVRILRPPVEAGGASSPKLEKTPTLTNDSVVELVEAGFSEGTIIRRIEQSPVEFDLSASKLAELRKRRVAEPVIAAMRAAMGDESEQPVRPEK